VSSFGILCELDPIIRGLPSMLFYDKFACQTLRIGHKNRPLPFSMALPSACGRKEKEGEIGVRSEAPHPNFATSSSWEAMRLRFV
jgi:hypothetical protein